MNMNEGSKNEPNRNEIDSHADDDHHKEELQAQIWTFTVFLASVPLLYLGYTKAAVCFIAIGILYIFLGQEDDTARRLSALDLYAKKYSTCTADDIVRDLQQWQIRCDPSHPPTEGDKKTLDQSYPAIVLLALSTLTKRYITVQHQQKKRMDLDCELTNIACSCQDSVHVCLLSPDGICNDRIISSSLALLALVSKSESVRHRYFVANQASIDPDKQYRIDDIINAIDLALVRGQDYSDESKEHTAAEVQRKACLLLGALSDGNEMMAQHIGQRGGIQSILNAISWYRCHEEVICWGLWALFILCYENYINKIILVQLDGIPILFGAMGQCPDSVEVARHGTAILFDLLRENNSPVSGGNTISNCGPTMDQWKIRNVAVSAGLHERILHVITQFSSETNMDIFLMGREILHGTNYQGPIPEPQMALVPSPQT
jgi:hypothetical protein